MLRCAMVLGSWNNFEAYNSKITNLEFDLYTKTNTSNRQNVSCYLQMYDDFQEWNNFHRRDSTENEHIDPFKSFTICKHVDQLLDVEMQLKF